MVKCRGDVLGFLGSVKIYLTSHYHAGARISFSIRHQGKIMAWSERVKFNESLKASHTSTPGSIIRHQKEITPVLLFG